MDAISELLKKFEDDEPPTQPTPTQVNPDPQDKPSSYRQGFAIYRKSTGGTAQGNQVVQLNLFKSFAKSIKSCRHNSANTPHEKQHQNLPAINILSCNELGHGRNQ